MEWMIGRDFKLERGSEPFLFRVTGCRKEVGNKVPEGVSANDLRFVKTDSFYLRCKVLETEEVEFDGEYVDVKIDKVVSEDQSKDIQEIPFDTVRVEWRQGGLTEL